MDQEGMCMYALLIYRHVWVEGDEAGGGWREEI